MPTKTLAIYVFHLYNKRVKKFLEESMYYSPYIDWIIVNNGIEIVNIPNYAKLITRPNLGYDFGAWSEAVLKDMIIIYLLTLRYMVLTVDIKIGY